MEIHTTLANENILSARLSDRILQIALPAFPAAE
jgi:hypothetical protein